MSRACPDDGHLLPPPRTLALLAGALILSATLAGCGLAETGVAGAAAGASQAEQVRQAKQTEARVQKQLDAAAQQDAERRRAAEADSQ
jgi:hypothetical protein